MGKRVRVVLTQDDIDKGIKMHGRLCPFALALQHRFPGARNVAMLVTFARVDKVTLRASERVYRAIISFDCEDGSAMVPGTYYFTAMEEE